MFRASPFREVGLLPAVRLIGKAIARCGLKAIALAKRNVVQRCCKADRFPQDLTVSRPEGSFLGALHNRGMN